MFGKVMKIFLKLIFLYSFLEVEKWYQGELISVQQNAGVILFSSLFSVFIIMYSVGIILDIYILIRRRR